MLTVALLQLVISWVLVLLALDAALADDIPKPGSSHLCVNNGHVPGKWVTRISRRKTFYVCSWDGGDYKENRALCGDHILQNKTLIHGLKTMNTQVGGRASMCDKRDDTRNTISQREQYAWEPMLCQLIPWDAVLFCELLGNRTILMMGDSRMLQTAGSLMSRLRNDLRPEQNCNEQLFFARANIFEHFATALVEVINATQPDIVIGNTGAHYRKLETLLTDIHSLAWMQRQQANTSKNSTWVWMTNNPGHVNCPQVSGGPLSDKFLDTQQITNDKFHWRVFPHMDSVAKAEATKLGMKIIDMSPLYYRQDAHSDCLHFCLPGPLDLFSVLLLNMLYNKEL